MNRQKVDWAFGLATALTGVWVALAAVAFFLGWMRRGFDAITGDDVHALAAASWPMASVLALWLLVAIAAKGARS